MASKEFTKEDGEFMVLIETPEDIQKKIRTWLTTGYAITIINQVIADRYLITTLLRRK